MLTIWKFPIPVVDSFGISMPVGAKILSVQPQGDRVCMWAIVDPSQSVERRIFIVVGTGHPIETLEGMNFIATFQIHDGALVFHLFECAK